MKEQFLFFLSFLTDKDVASVIPTSPIAVRHICDKMSFEGKKVFVEYGPGTGVISGEILQRMTEDSRLILIEQNPLLVKMLQKKFLDPRVIVVQDSAENIQHILAQCGETHADEIVSGIPFSQFPKDLRSRIVKQTHSALCPRGKFIVYQFRKTVGKDMQGCFTDIEVDLERKNLPPLTIFTATK